MRRCNIYDPPSSRYSALAVTPETLFSRTIPYETLVDMQSNRALMFDQIFLNNAITNLTDQAVRIRNSYPNWGTYDFSGSPYPMLLARLDAGPILESEYADFLVNNGITQDAVEALLATFDPNAIIDDTTNSYLSLLDTYYTENFSSATTGGFCSSFSGLLNSIMQVFSIIEGISDLIAQLQNIKQLLHTLVDQIRERLMQVMNQMVDQIASCMGIVVAAGNRIQRVAESLSETNVESIKERITEIIESVASKFEDLEFKPETIAYLIYRFCQLGSAVEQFMRSPMQGLQNLLTNCMDSHQVLGTVSNAATLSAVNAGAFRLSPGDLNSIRSRTGDRVNAGTGVSGGDSGPARPPQRYHTTPFTDQERALALDLKGASHKDAEAGNYRAHQYLDITGIVGSRSDDKGNVVQQRGEGYQRLHPNIIMIAIRISQRIGRQLYVNSGFRTQAFQDYLHRRDPKGAAKTGEHQNGYALDLSNLGDWNEFIMIASQEGIGGIGTYPKSGFIHIDIGARRTWPEGDDGYLAARTIHLRDDYRQGTPRDQESDIETPPARPDDGSTGPF